MNELTIHYSVVNSGDGSAYPIFMESKELAEWNQSNMDEGWGEPCTGSLSFESEGEIKCLEKIVTKESYFINNYVTGFQPNPEEVKEFIDKFFPEGLPHFSVKLTEHPDEEEYILNYIFANEKEIAKVFRSGDTSGDYFEVEINDFVNRNEFKLKKLKQQEINENEN